MRIYFTLCFFVWSAITVSCLAQSTVKVKIKKQQNGQTITEEKVFQLEDGQDLEEALKANGIDKQGATEFSISIENNSDAPFNGQLDIKGFPFENINPQADRPYLGITLKNDHLKAVITEVNPMSPAEKSNLKPGDIILKIDDLKIHSANELVEYIQTKKPGDCVNIKVKRKRKRNKIQVCLGVGQKGFWGNQEQLNLNFPNLFPETFKWQELPFTNESQTAFLGVMPNNSFTASGVQVDSVIQSSAAEKMGLLKGDIIIAINGNSIAQFDELRNYVAKQKPDSKCEVTIIRDGKTMVLDGAFGSKSIIIKDGIRIYKNEKGLDDQGQLNLDYELDLDEELDSNVQMLIDENGIQIFNNEKSDKRQIFIENLSETEIKSLKNETLSNGSFQSISFIPDYSSQELSMNIQFSEPCSTKLQIINAEQYIIMSDERIDKTTSLQQKIKFSGWTPGEYMIKIYQNNQLSLIKKLLVK